MFRANLGYNDKTFNQGEIMKIANKLHAVVLGVLAMGLLAGCGDKPKVANEADVLANDRKMYERIMADPKMDDAQKKIALDMNGITKRLNLDENMKPRDAGAE